MARLREEPDWSVVASGQSVDTLDPDGFGVTAEVLDVTPGAVVLAAATGGRRIVWAMDRQARNGQTNPGTTLNVSRAFSPSMLGEPDFVLPLRTPVTIQGFAGPEDDIAHFGTRLGVGGVRTLGEVTLLNAIGPYPAGSTMVLPFTTQEISSNMRAQGFGAQLPPRAMPDRDPTVTRGGPRPDSAFENDDEAGWASLPAARLR